MPPPARRAAARVRSRDFRGTRFIPRIGERRAHRGASRRGPASPSPISSTISQAGVSHECVLVHPHARRQPLSRHGRGRARRGLRLLPAGCRRGRHARLRRRAAADGAFVRGCVGGRLEPDSGDEAPEVPGRDPPGLVVAGALRADGVDVRPALRWAFADQRRDGRRFGRARRRWPLRRSRHALRDHRRLPAHLARAARRIARERRHRFRRRASEREGRQAAVPARSAPASAALVRRLVARRARDRGRPHRYVPELGRAARGGREEDRRHPRAAARSSSGFACT